MSLFDYRCNSGAVLAAIKICLFYRDYIIVILCIISFIGLLLCFRSHIFLIENRTLVFPYGIINIQIQVEEVQIELI